MALPWKSSFGENSYFNFWVTVGFTTNRNVSKFGRSQANLDGEKINENARVNTEAILRKRFAETAKPLFIGSIPIAASNTNLRPLQ
jgi:hypothetical protein